MNLTLQCNQIENDFYLYTPLEHIDMNEIELSQDLQTYLNNNSSKW